MSETEAVDLSRDPFMYRIEEFVKLGYDRELAVALAESRDKHGVFVYHKEVKDMIKLIEKQGKPADEALQIAFGIFSDV
jgi:hypothetical protein